MGRGVPLLLACIVGLAITSILFLHSSSFILSTPDILMASRLKPLPPTAAKAKFASTFKQPGQMNSPVQTSLKKSESSSASREVSAASAPASDPALKDLDNDLGDFVVVK
jgi:hypothetical protein